MRTLAHRDSRRSSVSIYVEAHLNFAFEPITTRALRVNRHNGLQWLTFATIVSQMIDKKACVRVVFGIADRCAE